MEVSRTHLCCPYAALLTGQVLYRLVRRPLNPEQSRAGNHNAGGADRQRLSRHFRLFDNYFDIVSCCPRIIVGVGREGNIPSLGPQVNGHNVVMRGDIVSERLKNAASIRHKDTYSCIYVRTKVQRTRGEKMTGYRIKRADFVQVRKRENEFIGDGYTPAN